MILRLKKCFAQIIDSPNSQHFQPAAKNQAEQNQEI